MKLTKPQKLAYDMERFAGGAIAVICGSMLMEGECSQEELVQAINGLYRLNDALRMHIVHTNEGAELVVTEYTEKMIEGLCFDDKAQLDSYASDYAKTPIDLHGELCEIRKVVLPGRYGILVKMHHLIGDAWTLSLIGSQLQQLLKGETPEAHSYMEYEASEAAYLSSKRCEKDKVFFMEQFAKCEEVTYLSDKQVHSYAAERKTVIVEADKARILADYMAAKGTTAFPLFMTVLAVYMSRVKMNAERFFIGTDVLNRSGAKEKNTAGMYINTVPVLVELNNTASFAENLAHVEEAVFGVFRHQKYNYGDILTDIRKEYSFSEKLYDTMLSYQNATLIGEAESTWYHSGMQTESLQIHIEDRDNKGVFRIHYDYQTEKFTAREIERMHRHIMTLLLDAISNEDKKLHELTLLSEEEAHHIMVEFNATKAGYPRDKCVHTLFDEKATKVPNKIAVIANDGILTYDQLNRRANRIAHGLISKGVQPGDVVAFMLPRTGNLIAAMLGVLKAGAAYLPISPDYPEDRITYMLEDSDSKLCIDTKVLDDLLQNDKDHAVEVATTPTMLCYCIYTSGSTGLPKGTLVCHSNIINNIYWRTGAYKNPTDYVINVSNTTTDTFQEELFYSLFSDGVFCLVEDNRSIHSIGCFAEKYAPSMIMTTPTFFQSIFHVLGCPFKHVVLVGEKLEAALAEQLLPMGVYLHNEYGPSECAVCASYGQIEDHDIHIGKPIDNVQIYIVDQFLQVVPAGVIGELCIAGDGVGAGYLHRPELTAEKFVDNPFGPGKLYRTGDLASWREDGNIAYFGRNDFQVKIRGLRIELEEIENVIDNVNGVARAAVVVRKNEEGRQLICAFYTEDAPTSVETIRSALMQKLPRYMVPHIFTVLPEFPMTASGKVNRKALPQVDLNCISNKTVYVKPQSDLEMQLAEFMEQVLGYAPVGRNDIFFDLGGDSLKAIELVAKAHSYGIEFSLQNVFDHPTVRQLCEHLDGHEQTQVRYSEEDFTKYQTILSHNIIDEAFIPQMRCLGNILLTGSTGFLGVHILDQFMKQERGTAYCLVRGGESRLRQVLAYYFDDVYTSEIGKRIIAIDGDITQGNLKEAAPESIQTVIHTAATVKHYGRYDDFYAVNVQGTRNVIALAQHLGAKMLHISTTSVSGNSLMDAFEIHQTEEEIDFAETSIYIGQPLNNVYLHSKFEAELAVLDAILSGLDAKIIRVGNLTNRTSDFRFQSNHTSNAFLKRMKAALELGCLPDYLMSLYAEFSPVDQTAEAIVRIGQYAHRQSVFHLNSNQNLYFGRLIEILNSLGISMRSIDGDAFDAKLQSLSKDAKTQYIYEAFQNDMDENGRLSYDSKIHIRNEFTIWFMEKLDFAWTPIDYEYLKGYIEYFRNIGYLEV